MRHVTIFVDNANIHPRNRQLVFRGLRTFLHDRTGPGDRIMVVTFHNDYEVVQPFTDSNADVVQAIDKLERTPSDGPEILAERRMVMRDLQSANLVPFSQNTDAFGNTSARMRVESESRQILQRIDNHARETRQRTLNTLGVMRYLVGSMAGLPEPKAMLYLSDGLEMRAAETLFLAHYDRFNEISQALEFDVPLDPPQATIEEYDLTKEFTEIAKNAQTAGVVFFAVDASGQTDTLGGSAEFSMRDIGSAGASGYRPVWDQRLDILGEQNRQSTLRLLADETGGAVLANTRDYDAFFEDLRANLDNYYSLGFQAPHDREGRRHAARGPRAAEGPQGEPPARLRRQAVGGQALRADRHHPHPRRSDGRHDGAGDPRQTDAPGQEVHRADPDPGSGGRPRPGPGRQGSRGQPVAHRGDQGRQGQHSAGAGDGAAAAAHRGAAHDRRQR